jgi:exopolyphosphatase/guanosine-5'-triphosphate,3'-diphosphate pyrophosphatase
MRVAAIDIGTNSVLLLVAELDAGSLRARHDEATITRLGQGVDATGRLAPEAVERTLACLQHLAERIGAEQVDRVGAVATSALRDAEHAESFLQQATDVLGFRPRVISGREEAELTFEGALGGLGLGSGPMVVTDLGGGSTELIVGETGEDGVRRIDAAVSLELGCVRMTERHLRHDPPRGEELEALRCAARHVLAQAPALGGKPLVGVAGTVTSVAALVHDVVPYDHARIHGSRLALAAVGALGERLAAMPLAARRALPALDPRRADLIVAGTLLLEQIMLVASASELRVSDHGVRWGLAERLVRSG